MSNLHLPKNPTLSDIQQYMVDMAEERGFSDQTLAQEYLMLTEEVGELAKCIRKSHAGMRLDSAKKYELDAAGEIADIIIVLITIANKMNVNVEQALRDKEEKNKKRVWE